MPMGKNSCQSNDRHRKNIKVGMIHANFREYLRYAHVPNLDGTRASARHFLCNTATCIHEASNTQRVPIMLQNSSNKRSIIFPRLNHILDSAAQEDNAICISQTHSPIPIASLVFEWHLCPPRIHNIVGQNTSNLLYQANGSRFNVQAYPSHFRI